MKWDAATVACVREFQARGLTKDEVLGRLQKAGKEPTWPAVRRALLRHKAELTVTQSGSTASEEMLAKARRRAVRHFLGTQDIHHRVLKKSESSITFRWRRNSGPEATVTVAVGASG